MKWLKDHGYRSVSLDYVTDDREALSVKREAQDSGMRDTRYASRDTDTKRVVITFDDGWRDNYEFALPVMKEFGWETEVYCHQVMMDAGRYKVYVGIAKADRNNRIGFFLWQKPHSVTVLTAKNLSSSDGTKKQLKEMAELMRQYSGDIEEL